MYRPDAKAAFQAAEKNLLPCRKCFGRAALYDDMQGYSADRDFKIACDNEDVCKTAIQTNNSPMQDSREKYGSLVALVEIWNAENRLELEWFPARQIPSSADLQKWDSQNSLRPLARPAQKTST